MTEEDVRYLGNFGEPPFNAHFGDTYFNVHDQTVYIFDGGWKQLMKYIPYPITDKELEINAKLYAEQESSCYTNDFYGFINGCKSFRQMVVDIIRDNPNDESLGKFMRNMFNEKGIL